MEEKNAWSEWTKTLKETATQTQKEKHGQKMVWRRGRRRESLKKCQRHWPRRQNWSWAQLWAVESTAPVITATSCHYCLPNEITQSLIFPQSSTFWEIILVFKFIFLKGKRSHLKMTFWVFQVWIKGMLFFFFFNLEMSVNVRLYSKTLKIPN